MAQEAFTFPQAPKRLALAGDWHANTDYARRAIRRARKWGADVLVHVGDFGYHFTESYLRALTEELEAQEMTLLFVDGNHENFDVLYSYPLLEGGYRPLTSRMAHLPRGFRWTWHGEEWVSLGGAYSVDRPWRHPGSSYWYQEVLTLGDLEAAKAGGRATYMVTHDVPLHVTIPGITLESGMRHGYAPEDLAAADHNRLMLQEACDVVAPKRLWAGHYHRREDLPVSWKDGSEGMVHILHKDEEQLEKNLFLFDPATGEEVSVEPQETLRLRSWGATLGN